MLKLNKILLDFETRNKVLPTLNPTPTLPANFSKIEMSEFDSAFLCGLIKKYEPKKILEVGIATGATTAIILQCLEDIGQNYKMYSVDVSEKYYRTHDRPSGFLAENIRQNLKFGSHQFLLGNVLPVVIDDIGGDIDFIILDTTHSLPGEVLDFLVALPFLTDSAVVCMHDVAYHHTKAINALGYATGLLFSSVVADKILNFMPKGTPVSYNSLYPNIAAFQINSQTIKNVCNVFLALSLRWNYLPTQAQFEAYSNFILQNYSRDLYSIFVEASLTNINNLTNRK